MRPALLLLALALPALAADPPPPKKPAASAKKADPKKDKKKVKVPTFEMPSFGELPKADGVVGAQRNDFGVQTRSAAADATYEVVKVQHAKQFSGGVGGSTAIQPLDAVAVKGTPPTTEKFSSVIRVKSPQRAGAAIDVVILDTRGDTALTASGDISYRGGASDETEWIVDWDPSPVRGAGEYKVLVRIAGQPMGTWPLVLVQK